MVVESPITELQKRFPLPESLYDIFDPDFRDYVHSLNSDLQEQLGFELIKWGQPLGVESEVSEQNRPLVRNLELLIGELVHNPPPTWPEKYRDSGVYHLLMPPERGELLRYFATQPSEITPGV